MRVVFSPAANAEADQALDWWLEHRDKAPELFEEELEQAIAKLERTPYAGERAVTRGLGFEVRFVSMAKTRYRLYYRVKPEEDAVEVLRLWHMSRGTGPEL